MNTEILGQDKTYLSVIAVSRLAKKMSAPVPVNPQRQYFSVKSRWGGELGAPYRGLGAFVGRGDGEIVSPPYPIGICTLIACPVHRIKM